MATTAFSVKLMRGAATLDLNTLPFEIGEGFTPPETLVMPMTASGTSANRYSGAALTGRAATNRDWSFPLHIEGVSGASSEAQIRNSLFRLKLMLDGAGDPDYPTYLVYRANTDTLLEPLWGQAALLYEIVYGNASLSSDYSVSDMRGRALPNCTVSLTIKPYALGRMQALARATGGVLPDQWGTADGAERGVIVCPVSPSGGNYFKNPVFGDGLTTYTAAANIIATLNNTDPRYRLPQVFNSVLLQSLGSSNNTFTASLTAANTNTYTISAYLMRPDFTAIDTSDFDLMYNSIALTLIAETVYPNGLCKVEATFTGINSAKPVGLRVKSGRTVYLLALQMEERLGSTDLFWGDLLGCAWNGSAHAAASTRTAGQLSVAIDDTVLRTAQGSIALTWIAPRANVTYSATTYILWDARLAGSGLVGYYDGTLAAFVMVDGSGNAAAGAVTFSAGDVIQLTFTWGPALGMAVYQNGVRIGLNGTFVPPALGTRLYIGSAAAGNSQIDGTFSDFRTYAHEMTAAEVSNDYNNTSKLTGATLTTSQRVGAIPWEWTNRGDDIVDPVGGTVSSVAQYNWFVCGGIPGSVAAVTEMKLHQSTGANTLRSLWLSRSLWPFFYNPTTVFYNESSGTADSGNSSGDAYHTLSVSSSGTTAFDQATINNYSYLLLQGRECYLFARLKDAGSNLTMALDFVKAGSGYLTDYTALAADGTMRLFKSAPFIFPRLRHKFFDDTITAGGYSFYPLFTRSSGGGANVGLDFCTLMARPLTQLNAPSSVVGSVNYIVNGYKAEMFTTGGSYNDTALVNGDAFELEPGGYNVVQFLPNSIADSFADVTVNLTLTKISVQPRYAIL